MRTTSRHVLAELYECDNIILNDVATIRLQMLAAAHVIGATVVGEVFHRFSPCGVSGVVLIAESHLSIHTWPESAYLAIDIFTCGQLDPVPGIGFLAEAVGARQYRLQEILRGLSADLDSRIYSLLDNSKLITAMAPLCQMHEPESFGRRSIASFSVK